MDKKDISKTELFSRSNKNKIDVDLNLSNYATKSDLKMEQALITICLKDDLANLRSESRY